MKVIFFENRRRYGTRQISFEKFEAEIWRGKYWTISGSMSDEGARFEGDISEAICAEEEKDIFNDR